MCGCVRGHDVCVWPVVRYVRGHDVCVYVCVCGLTGTQLGIGARHTHRESRTLSIVTLEKRLPCHHVLTHFIPTLCL